MKLQHIFDSVDRENRNVILSLVEPNERARILDCGCSDGDFTKKIADKAKAIALYGVEFVEEVARSAEENVIKVCRVDLNNELPIDSETFDFVYANQVNVVPLIFGRQPFTAHISNEVIVGTLFSPPYDKHQPGRAHLRLFTCDGIKRLFEYHGFKAERMIGVGYYPFPSKIARLLSRVDKRHAAYLTMKIRK